MPSASDDRIRVRRGDETVPVSVRKYRKRALPCGCCGKRTFETRRLCNGANHVGVRGPYDRMCCRKCIPDENRLLHWWRCKVCLKKESGSGTTRTARNNRNQVRFRFAGPMRDEHEHQQGRSSFPFGNDARTGEDRPCSGHRALGDSMLGRGCTRGGERLSATCRPNRKDGRRLA